MAGSANWLLCLRFRPTGDAESDWTWIGQSLPWFKSLATRDQVELGEALCEKGLACLACSGPEEAAARLSSIRHTRVQGWVLEPDGTEFAPPGLGLDSDRRRRSFGVYPTPRALTRFVVRAVDGLLQSRLGLAGLHDPEVRLLDPAAGPMNFLLEAYRRAMARARREGGRGGLDRLAREHLLPHFQGIEILPGPWTAGLQEARRLLARLGLSAGDEPFPLFLADALANPEVTLAGFLGEQAAGARCCLDGPVTVVLGNPPFGPGSGLSRKWITELMRGYGLPGVKQSPGYLSYRGGPLGERNPKWLSDEYVRFLRLAQYLVDRNGRGIVAFVVNHNCLDAPTFRGVRDSLLRSFDEIFTLDLHGNQRKREKSPSGAPDENVFAGVAQGVAVLFLVKGARRRAVYRGDLYGRRETKLRALAGASLASLPWREIRPRAPYHPFRLQRASPDYGKGVPLPEIFPVHSLGVVTGNDARAIAFRREDFEPELASQGRHDLRRRVKPILVRPFDLRQALYVDSLLARPRSAVMAHLVQGRNLALLAVRQSRGESGAFVARGLAGHKAVHAYSPNTVFPLWLVDSGGEARANLGARFLDGLEALLREVPAAEEVFGYIYAVLHDARYLSRFSEELGAGFPRIPLPDSRERFQRLAGLGRELVSLHLLEDARLSASSVRIDACPAGSGGRPRYEEKAGKVIADGMAFLGIEPDVWGFRVGSYRVLETWLRARRGRAWDLSALRELGWIIHAIRHSLAVLAQIFRED